MSGPKVVRVVTREEMVAQCEGALARLDRCLQIWRQTLSQMGRLSESSNTEAAARRQELESVLMQDRFADVLSQAAAEVGFLEADIDSQRQRFTEAKAMEVARRESAHRTAREVAKLLTKSGTANSLLLAELERVSKGQGTLVEADAVLARAFAAMSPRTEVGLSESQRALAKRLGNGASDESLQVWKDQHARRDVRLEPVNRMIAEISTLDATVSSAYEVRLAQLLALEEGPSRNLRIDSLALDLATARTGLRRLTRLRRDAELLCAEIEVQGEAGLAKSTERLNEGWNDADQLEVVLAEERAALDAARKRQAAAVRRAAVLKGLSSLGYSVSEGMSTALAGGGRLVLQKRDMPGYGVELAGGENAERLQVRAVALAKSRDNTKDLAAETKWCSDLSDLCGALAAVGTQIVIEQALPVGKVPLRVIESEDVDGVDGRRGGTDVQKRWTTGGGR